MERRVNYAYIGLIIGTASVSTAAIFVKLSTAPSSIIAFYRLLFSVIILSIPTLILNKKELRSLSKKEGLYTVLAGIFLAFHFITWFESLKYTSVASSVVLVTLQPIFAMVGGFLLFKDRVSIRGIIGTLLALIGSTIISWGDLRVGGLAFYGDVLAVIGAILVTGYWLVGQSLRKNLSLLTYTFLVYGTSSIVLFIYNFTLQENFTQYDVKNWSLFLALAIIPNIFGHTVFNWVIKYLNATTISTAILAEPVGATILAYLLLGEGIATTQMIGGFIILIGIFIYLKFK